MALMKAPLTLDYCAEVFTQRRGRNVIRRRQKPSRITSLPLETLDHQGLFFFLRQISSLFVVLRFLNSNRYTLYIHILYGASHDTLIKVDHVSEPRRNFFYKSILVQKKPLIVDFLINWNN